MLERLHLLLSALVLVSAAATAGPRYDLGHPPSAARIAAADSAIGPDGAELPEGSGDAPTGQALYAARCAHCHGAQGQEGPDPPLVGGRGSLDGPRPLQTIGSYWSHATTVYDYIARAMPFTAPGSLTPNEVYALTAYLLAANGIIDEATVLDRHSLPAVVMPNRDGFVPDPRPDLP